MIAGLQEIDDLGGHPVDDPMLLGEPSRPGSPKEMLEWFRFPNPRKRITQDRFNQIEEAKRGLPVRLDPEPEVIEKFGLKDGKPGAPAGWGATLRAQARSPVSIARPSEA